MWLVLDNVVSQCPGGSREVHLTGLSCQDGHALLQLNPWPILV